MKNRSTFVFVIGAAVAAVVSMAILPSGVGAAKAPAPVAVTPPTPEETFVSECGACHIAFPAGFLPKRSWQAIIDGLAKHFDEDASLDEATTKVIAGYLLANAADAADPRTPVVRGLKATDVPLRITETPFWRRIHQEVNPAVFAGPKVKSASNCLACHAGSGN